MVSKLDDLIIAEFLDGSKKSLKELIDGLESPRRTVEDALKRISDIENLERGYYALKSSENPCEKIFWQERRKRAFFIDPPLERILTDPDLIKYKKHLKDRYEEKIYSCLNRNGWLKPQKGDEDLATPFQLLSQKLEKYILLLQGAKGQSVDECPTILSEFGAIAAILGTLKPSSFYKLKWYYYRNILTKFLGNLLDGTREDRLEYIKYYTRRGAETSREKEAWCKGCSKSVDRLRPFQCCFVNYYGEKLVEADIFKDKEKAAQSLAHIFYYS